MSLPFIVRTRSNLTRRNYAWKGLMDLVLDSLFVCNRMANWILDVKILEEDFYRYTRHRWV